jgi:hypothetical protein
MHTQERVRGRCCGNADCHGEGGTSIKITCRDFVKNTASNCVIAGLNMRGVLISKSVLNGQQCS